MLDARSVELRKQIIDIVKTSRRGHIGSAFSIVEIVRVMYDDILNYKAGDPNCDKRDRFILSKGHACLALYVILADKGFFSKKILNKFCQSDAALGGHPEKDKIPGVEASTGSLGHGLSLGVGITLASRIKKTKFDTYVLLSDGECNEGSIWEAALSAAQHKLDNLYILIDNDHMQSYGKTEDILNLESLYSKWHSFNFDVEVVDGHDIKAIKQGLKILKTRKEKPHVLICNTVKGKGIDFIENNPFWHHKSKISDEEINQLCEKLA
jgi:transketolase